MYSCTRTRTRTRTSYTEIHTIISLTSIIHVHMYTASLSGFAQQTTVYITSYSSWSSRQVFPVAATVYTVYTVYTVVQWYSGTVVAW